MSSNLTEITLLPTPMQADGDMPVVRCLECHQSLKEAAGQTRTLLELKKEVKKLKAMVLRTEVLPAAIAHHFNFRIDEPVAETRVNFSRQTRMRSNMGPPSKLARLNRLRQAYEQVNSELQGNNSSDEVDNDDNEESPSSSASTAARKMK